MLEKYTLINFIFHMVKKCNCSNMKIMEINFGFIRIPRLEDSEYLQMHCIIFKSFNYKCSNFKILYCKSCVFSPRDVLNMPSKVKYAIINCADKESIYYQHIINKYA